MKNISFLLLAALIHSSIVSMHASKMGIPVSYNQVTVELGKLDTLLAQLRTLGGSRPAGTFGIPTDSGSWVDKLATAVSNYEQNIKTTVDNAQNALYVLQSTPELQALQDELNTLVNHYNGIFNINLEGIPQQATDLYNQIVAQLNTIINAITNAPV